MAVNSEILFARVQNQLHVAKNSSDCGIIGIKKYFFSTKLTDFSLNIGAPSLLGERLFKQISFHI